MLHTSKSKKKNQLKVLVILPLLVVFLMSFSTKEIYLENASNKSTSVSKKGDITLIIISKNMSDDDLDKTIAEFKESDVDLKISNVKRNNKGEIIKISISASTKHSKAKFEADSEKPISSISIEYNSEDDAISIGSANSNSFAFKTNDGKHHIRTSAKGSNVFIHTTNSDDDSDSIIEEEDKIIINSGGKHKIIKKNSAHSVHIISDDDTDGLDEEVIKVKSNLSNNNNVKKQKIVLKLLKSTLLKRLGTL